VSKEFWALAVIVVFSLIMGGIAFHTSATEDLNLQHQIRDEKLFHGDDLPRWYRRTKRTQQVLSVVALACFVGIAWAVHMFSLALEPGADPESTGIAIGAATFGVPGLLICSYQIARFGVRRRAISTIQKGE